MPFNNSRLKELRIKAGVSKYEVAFGANVELSSYCRLESGEYKNPKWKTVERISDYFKVNMETFKTGIAL